MTRTALALVGALALTACSRVPEQQLRDEQARSRRYRDAYEAALAEKQDLLQKLTAAQLRAAACQGSPTAPLPKSPQIEYAAPPVSPPPDR